jgi:hypothetical protein
VVEISNMIKDVQPQNLYVAFLDILGFGNRIVDDYLDTLQLYDDLISLFDTVRPEPLGKVSTRIFSDSILAVSEELKPLLSATSVFHWGALLLDCLLRGGIARGRHLEVSRNTELFVVSEPLVHGARLEKEVKRPCVAIHSTVVPTKAEVGLRDTPNLHRHLLFHEGRWIVNPFSIAWGTSAAMHAKSLRDRYPAFADAYTWFLHLYEAVFTGPPLIPDVWPPAA